MKITRKLLLSILSAFVLVGCLTTTTFAWFNVYSSAEVELFNVKVKGGQGFLVSVDNEHFYNDLENEDILNAILMSYGETENPSQPSFQLREEVLYYSGSEAVVSYEEKIALISEMKIKPRTSFDGVNLMDLNNFEIYRNDGSYDGVYESVEQTDGSFIRFNVYFKATNRSTTSNEAIEIYLNGEDYQTMTDNEFEQKFSDYSELEKSFIKTIKPTKIFSAKTNVKLIADLTSFDRSYVGGELIPVYPSNAMRFSIYDPSKFEENEAHSAPIYELVNSENLGSYATNYEADKDDDPNHTSEDKALLTRLYDSRYNAGFTYYNHLKASGSGLDAFEFSRKPKTYSDLLADDLPTVTTVKAGEDAKKITFTFWLEGWDAECFDGIQNDITVYLAFRSKKATTI